MCDGHEPTAWPSQVRRRDLHHHGRRLEQYLGFEVVPRTTTGTPNVGVATSTVTSIAVRQPRRPQAPTDYRHAEDGRLADWVVNYNDAEDDAQGTPRTSGTPRPMRPAPTARRSWAPPAIPIR
jgi:hypothetical protein